jgi:hypothetical protein
MLAGYPKTISIWTGLCRSWKQVRWFKHFSMSWTIIWAYHFGWVTHVPLSGAEVKPCYLILWPNSLITQSSWQLWTWNLTNDIRMIICFILMYHIVSSYLASLPRASGSNLKQEIMKCKMELLTYLWSYQLVKWAQEAVQHHLSHLVNSFERF